MNRKLLSWGIALSVFALNLVAARGQGYEFAVVPNNGAVGFNLNAVANNGNTFVCVGGANSPTFAINYNNFSSFAGSNFNGGYLLLSNVWQNSLGSKIKYNWLSCVATQQVGFIASGASNAVFVSTDGVNWTNLVHVNPGNSSIVIQGIAYNPTAATFADAEANNSESYTMNPSNGWHGAGLGSGASLAETFLAVASSSGSSNMALCGILGDIRISTNAGQSWFISQQINTLLPNLTSVAYDTGSDLVCAGNSSLIEVGTNGGFSSTNWASQNKIVLGTSGSSTNFNAVAYTPTTANFLAAGALGGNGLIVMATNSAPVAQWTWTRQTNLFALQNGAFTRVTTALPALNGATFANSGFFQGIGMIVGNDGAIVIAGLPPSAPINTVGNDVTNFMSNPQINSPLGGVGNIVADANHPAGVLGLDWYSAAVGGTELATNTAVFSPPGSLYGTCGTFTVWAQERDLRTGFFNTNRAAFMFTILPVAPTNAAVGVADALGTAYTPVWVKLLVNAANPASSFAVNWYNTAVGSNSLNFLGNGSPANIGNQFFFTPADTACGTYTVWAETKAISTQPSGLPLMSTNRVPVTYTIIPGAPVNPVSATNCAGNGTFGMCANPSLSVTVASATGQTNEVNWYDGNSNFLATATSGNNSFTYTPTNAAPGVYTFYAQSTNLPTGFVSPSWTPVTFQVNPLPQWLSSAGFVTNVDSTSPQTNPVIPPPAVANASTITSFEPGANITFDWYTNGDPNVSTYENPNPPYAYGSGGPGGTIVPTFGGFSFIPTNTAPGSYTYYVRARVVFPGFTACACQSTNLVTVTFNLVPPGATNASGGITNVLTGAAQANLPIWVDVLVNSNQLKNLTMDWFATSNSVNNIDNLSDTNQGARFFHTPTNALCGVFTNWAQTKAGGILPGKTRFPVTFVIIPTAPSAVGSIDVTNCVDVPDPTLTVAVTNGQTARWFAVPSSGTPLTNSLSFTPTNSAPGTTTFSVQAVDTNSGLAGTNFATAALTLTDCTGPLTISNNPAAGTSTIQWPGDLVLLSSSNLVNWTIVSTGTVFVAPNTLIWTNASPPVQFFRLTN